MRHQRAESPVKLDGPEPARTFFAGCLADAGHDRESLWVAHLDEEARCLHLSRHHGDESGVDFPIRQIISDAVAHGSAAILMAHNHPSGDARPSESDWRATRRLAAAAEAIDCALVDHFVFGGNECTSFRTLGLL
ncbi:MAG TPA: JAB domain-containing protein [Sphingomicrobium sp.]|nr:JAB domain-containing protein [Sphingomicrobium sp.]